MKLPSYGVLEAPGVSLGAPRLPADDPIASAVSGAGESLERVAELRARAERSIQESRQAVGLAKLRMELDAFTADRVEKTDSSVAAADAAEQYRQDATRFVRERTQGITDERYRNLAVAHLMARVGQGALEVRQQANKRWIEDTQTEALDQLRRLSESGTDEDFQTALGLIDGLTAAGIFSAEAGARLGDQVRREAPANALSRLLEADPEEAFNRVNERRGIFATLSDADQARFLARARQKIEHDQDRAWEEQRRAEHNRDRAVKMQAEERVAGILDGIARGQIAPEQLPDLTAGLPPGEAIRVYDFQAAHQSRQREAVRFAQAQAANEQKRLLNGYLARIPLGTREDVRTVLRQVEIDYAAGKIGDEVLASVRQYAQSQLDHLIRVEEHAATEQEQALKREYAAAILEVPGWLGSDPSEMADPEFRQAHRDAVEELKAVGSMAVLAGQSPWKAMREAVPQTVSRLYATAKDREGEMWRRLAPYKSEREVVEALQSGRVSDTRQRLRMIIALEAVRYLRSVQPTTGAGTPGGSPKPAKSWKPLPEAGVEMIAP